MDVCAAETAPEGRAGRPAPGRATAAGLVAIACWSSLALLTRLAAPLPPLELLGASFTVAFVVNTGFQLRHGLRGLRDWRQPPGAWALAFCGIFIYHALYFTALALAPAAGASLVAYLWPLLIVLMSTLSLRAAFRPRHLWGAGLGFLGTAFVVLGPAAEGGGAPFPHATAGYAAAAAAAVVWSGYSVTNRRFSGVPSGMIGGVCGLVAVAGGAFHFLLEPTVAPSAAEWGTILLLGLGPVGGAFLAWDHATKHGHLPLIGALSYLTPLASTLLLIATGYAAAGWPILAAAGLIVLGAGIAASGRRAGSGGA